jgi:hypothetical protein
MKKIIYLSALILTFVSCNKTLDFDDEGYANQIVVNSTISTNSYFVSYINKSRSILTKNQSATSVEGSMELFEDGILIRQFPTQVGAFAATDILPKAGKTYRMVVTTEGKKLEAETMIPNKVEVLSVDTASVKTNNNLRNIIINLRIKDPAGDDFYRIVYMREAISSLQDNKGVRKYYKSYSQYGIATDDPVFKSVYNNFGDEIIDGPNNEYYIFPDDYFNGKEYSIKFRTNPGNNNIYYSGYGGPYGYGVSKLIYERNEIHVQKLSKDLYNYLKYLKLYNFYHDNPFAEPVPVYSNVKNGIGIFAGYNDEVKFEYEKKLIPFSMDTIKIEDAGYGY